MDSKQRENQIDRNGGQTTFIGNVAHASGIKEHTGLKFVSVREDRAVGDKACVAMDVVFNDGKFIPATFLFHKEGDEWRIVVSDKDFPPTPFQPDPADPTKPRKTCDGLP